MVVTHYREWKKYWGDSFPPVGAEVYAKISISGLGTGVLFKLQNGLYVMGQAGKKYELDQLEVKKAITKAGIEK